MISEVLLNDGFTTLSVFIADGEAWASLAENYIHNSVLTVVINHTV